MEKKIILAAKCAPEQALLEDVYSVGISAVELYLSGNILADVDKVISTCREFPLQYVLHAPGDGSSVQELAKLAKEISAKVIVFHDVFWESEWVEIIKMFEGMEVRLCVENTHSVHEPVKFMRRFGMGRCLDIEHLQFQCCGIFEEAYMSVIRQATHIHLTGYFFGSQDWHTPIDYHPERGKYWLNLIKQCGYQGFVVSEAKPSFQNRERFKKLNDFFKDWEKDAYGKAD